jgi:hypothetical protein
MVYSLFLPHSIALYLPYDTSCFLLNTLDSPIQWTVPLTAISGVYIALPVYHLSAPRVRLNEWLKGSYIPFVVRETYIAPHNPSAAATSSPTASTTTLYRGSDVLFKTADTTWVAYNKYGN